MSYIQRICILLLFVSIWSCTSDSKVDPSSDRIVVYSNNSPKGLNPIINVATSPILSLTNLPLAHYNPKTLEYTPIMLKYLPIDTVYSNEVDGNRFAYYVEFKEGLTWDDGSPMDMNDYIFTLKIIKNPSINSPRYRALFKDVVDIIPNADNLGGFIVFEKYAMNSMEKITNIPLLQEGKFDPNHLLRSITIPMQENEESYKQKEAEVEGLSAVIENFNQATQNLSKINGGGRYKITNWKLDEFVQLEKKANHWSEKYAKDEVEAKPKTIIYSFVSDAAAALPQLKNGDFDIIPSIDLHSYQALKNDPDQREKFNFESVRLPRFYFLGLNTRKLLLQQKEVRKALQLVVNVDTIIATMENGFGTRINSPFLNLGSDSQVQSVSFNPTKAKEILKNAGWKDANQDGVLEKEINGKIVPLKLSIIMTGKKLGNFIAALTKQDAAKVGIDIELLSMDVAAMRKKVRAHDFDMIVSGSTSSLAPYDPYSAYHTNNVAPGKGNNYGFGNDESDQLIEMIQAERNPAKRQKHYIELEKMIHDEVPMIFLYSPTERIVLKKGLNCLLSNARPGYFPNTAYFE